MVKHINEKEFEDEVLKEKGLVVVDFFANWCRPCSMLAPLLEEIQEEMKNIKIVKVNIDENQKVAKDYRITNIPTIKIFKNGEEYITKTGFLPKESLIEFIEKSI